MNRQEFLIKLARSLMTFGAPSHRIESQLVAAARILEVEAEFIHLPGIIICSFGDQELGCSETHFVKCGGRLSLGALHKVHLIYRSVVHDEISAKQATEQLEALLVAAPLYSVLFRCFLAFCLSALICPLAFGGSFLDMWIAGAAAFILACLQLRVAEKSALYANVFEYAICLFSMVPALKSPLGLQHLSSSPSLQEASAAFVAKFSATLLYRLLRLLVYYQGISFVCHIYLLLTTIIDYSIVSSSLELASKNIVCGSVKMVYALIYTLFLVIPSPPIFR